MWQSQIIHLKHFYLVFRFICQSGFYQATKQICCVFGVSQLCVKLNIHPGSIYQIVKGAGGDTRDLQRKRHTSSSVRDEVSLPSQLSSWEIVTVGVVCVKGLVYQGSAYPNLRIFACICRFTGHRRRRALLTRRKVKCLGFAYNRGRVWLKW